MRVWICCITLLLLFSTAGSLQAEIFTFPLPAAGTYGNQEFEVDFGQSFASIQSLSIAWTGHIIPGWSQYESDPEPKPLAGTFLALIKNDAHITSMRASTPALGDSTYPDREQFDLVSGFEPSGSSSWDWLLDGTATLVIELDMYYFLYPEPDHEQPIGELYSATLILDATPVPEPASIITFLAGGFGIASWTMRNRGR